jgi:hypothetical protein
MADFNTIPSRDGSSSGLRSGLSPGKEFANGLLHSLRLHRKARNGTDGIILPIDEDCWQKTFLLEFPRKPPCKDGHMQPLGQYCNYYNYGQHGCGYDLKMMFDFGRGQRRKDKQFKGSSVAGTEKAVHPGSRTYVTPDEAIRLVMNCWNQFHADDSHVDSPTIQAEDADDTETDESYSPHDGDQRPVVERQIRERRGQQKFRNDLRKRYGNRCLERIP